MKKSKQDTFTINLPKRDLQLKDVKITANKIKDIIEKEVKTIVEHFESKDGGWDLCKDFIVSDILQNIFGFDIDEEINQVLLRKKLHIKYKNRKAFICSQKEYNPIYINVKTGKLHVVEDTEDKSYIFKYLSRNGYEYIGRL